MAKINVGFITEHHFKCLWTLFPDEPEYIATAAADEMRKLYRQMPSRKGIWHGERVVVDDKGAMSSGYLCYEDHMGCPSDQVQAFKEVEWLDDPERNRLGEIRDKLAPLARTGEL